MPDKSNFTPDEWKLLLESVMTAGIAISAAEPSGLWGLLKESFAEGKALMTAKLDPGADALIKAVVADFETADGRSIARDGLKEKFTGSKPAEIKAKCIDTLRQAWCDSRCQGTRRCSGLQGLAAPDQPTRCRSGPRRWIFRYGRGNGKR